ncbi:MAG: PTS sugar transporter subunit IIA [Treponema sp.]|nr:PTS sugar transporter subunit IIA [Treponema sp.]
MLNEIFSPMRIKLNLESNTKTGVFGELVETISVFNPELDDRELLEAVISRESKMNTIIRPGIAVPHGYCSKINGIIGAIGFSEAGIKYGDISKDPVNLFFLLLLDEYSREKHLYFLSRLLDLLNSPEFPKIGGMESPEDVYNLLCDF